MRKYSVISPLWMSFYSRQIYRDVAQTWKGAAFIYLLILLMITWLPYMYKWVRTIEHTATQVSVLVKQVPIITIKHGKASIEKASPYFIKDPESNAVMAIIDTSGKYTDLKNTSAFILLTADEIIYKSGTDDTRSRSLKDFKDIKIGTVEIAAVIERVKYWALLLLYPMTVLISYIIRLIQVLIYGLIGLVFTFFTHTHPHLHIPYGMSVRCAIIAITPAMLLATLLNVLGISFPYEWLVYFLISMCYLYYAIDSLTPVPLPTAQ